MQKIFLFIFIFFFAYCSNEKSIIQIIPNDAAEKVDVFVNGNLFTSYMYSSQIKHLKKTILFPVYSPNGNMITRGYPLQPTPGERVDHPHQIGFWLNYGDVNGLDFWNHSDAIPPDRKHEMGTIKHNTIKKLEGNQLAVIMDWVNAEGEIILKEDTRFIFNADASYRSIDRITQLTAVSGDVLFKDNKEGMVAIRVTRALEHPTNEPIVVTDAAGVATEVPVKDNTGVTGNYTNSHGITGIEVWGKRAPWVMLSGKVNTEPVVVALFDHPENTGYPTFWHARGYGLFAANPLGQKIFSDGQLELNFELKEGSSTTFRYRLFIYSGDLTIEQMESYYQAFIQAVP
jgi:hypothetical protein